MPVFVIATAIALVLAELEADDDGGSDIGMPDIDSSDLKTSHVVMSDDSLDPALSIIAPVVCWPPSTCFAHDGSAPSTVRFSVSNESNRPVRRRAIMNGI